MTFSEVQEAHRLLAQLAVLEKAHYDGALKASKAQVIFYTAQGECLDQDLPLNPRDVIDLIKVKMDLILESLRRLGVYKDATPMPTQET